MTFIRFSSNKTSLVVFVYHFKAEFDMEFYGQVNIVKFMSSWSVNLLFSWAGLVL